MSAPTTTTATPTLEVATLDIQRLPLSGNPPNSKLTWNHIDRLYQVYWWLMEAGDEYTEQAEILRDIYLFLKNMLDVEAGIKQGYLDSEGTPIVPKAV